MLLLTLIDDLIASFSLDAISKPSRGGKGEENILQSNYETSLFHIAMLDDYISMTHAAKTKR